MRGLPPFARALKTRRPGAEMPPPARYVPDSDTKPRDYDSDSAPPFPQCDRPEVQPKEQDYIDEIQDLRLVIQDLEQQVSELSAENRKLQQSQAELEASKQLTSELHRQIDELHTQLRDEILKNKCLSEQVEQLETLLESKRQLTEAKEQMVRRIQTEYHQVMGDYQRLLEVNSEQAGQLRQARVDISELDAQIAQLRSAPRRPDFQVPLDRHRSRLDDFIASTESTQPAFEQSMLPPPIDDAPPPPHQPAFDLPFDNTNMDKADPVPVTKQPSPTKKAALYDNIRFGDEPAVSTPVEDDTESMTVPEMKQHLEMLRQQKEELERALNKAPAKGRLMAHVRREQEENEAELDSVTKRMARLRFTLRKLHAL